MSSSRTIDDYIDPDKSTSDRSSWTVAKHRKWLDCTDEEWEAAKLASAAVYTFRKWYVEVKRPVRHSGYKGKTADDVVSGVVGCERCREEPPARCECWKRRAQLMSLAIHICRQGPGLATQNSLLRQRRAYQRERKAS